MRNLSVVELEAVNGAFGLDSIKSYVDTSLEMVVCFTAVDAVAPGSKGFDFVGDVKKGVVGGVAVQLYKDVRSYFGV